MEIAHSNLKKKKQVDLNNLICDRVYIVFDCAQNYYQTPIVGVRSGLAKIGLLFRSRANIERLLLN